MGVGAEWKVGRVGLTHLLFKTYVLDKGERLSMDIAKVNPLFKRIHLTPAALSLILMGLFISVPAGVDAGKRYIRPRTSRGRSYGGF